MNKIALAKAPEATSPNPITLICTKKADGTTNMATIAWWTYVSFNPGMIAVAINNGAHTGERIRETKELVLAVPGTPLAQALIQCGTSSGRNTDKIAKFGIQMEAVDGTDIKVPAHTRLAIHAELKECVDGGDHTLYVCTVKNAFANEGEDALFGWKGYGELAAAQKK